MNKPDPQLIAEAYRDIAAYDQGGQMAARLERLEKIVQSGRDLGVDTVSRKSLSLIITGDEKSCEILANAYAKALHGLGVTYGKGSGPVINSIDWTAQICDPEATRTLQEHSWANTKMYEAKDEAEGGVLVIRNIHEPPYAGFPDEEEATPKALAGGLQAVSTFMNDYAEEDYIPVIVLTGPGKETGEFLSKNPDLASYFNGKAVRADAAPPSLPVYNTHLETPVTVRSPLKLKPRSA
jgi:hypothetical protein